MKKHALVIPILLLSLYVAGCSESFEPVAEFKDKFALNCILTSRDSTQYCTVTKGYPANADGSASVPDSNSVTGSLIRLWVGDSVYFFRDTVGAYTSSRGTGIMPYYAAHNYTAEAGRKYDIEAILPSGKKLQSTLTMPSRIELASGMDTIQFPIANADFFTVSWRSALNDGTFLPKFWLSYAVKVDSAWIPRTKLLPTGFITRNGKKEYYYPQPTKASSLTVSKAALAAAFSEISAGDDVKSNYRVISFILEINSMDKNLAEYYSATVSQNDNFSIRLDDYDFSNVTGGFGVFGGLLTQQLSLRMNYAFIKEFGYIF